MAFIAEDGTGLKAANSYATVQAADAYFADRGNLVWVALTDAQKESSLIQATDYMENRYGILYLGDKQFDVSYLQFPRINIPDIADGMPDQLIKATCEYALRASFEPLMPDPVYNASGYPVKSSKVAVGPVVESYSYAIAVGVKPILVRSYPAADIYMKQLIMLRSKYVIR